MKYHVQPPEALGIKAVERFGTENNHGPGGFEIIKNKTTSLPILNTNTEAKEINVPGKLEEVVLRMLDVLMRREEW